MEHKKEPIVECGNLVKIYKTDEIEVIALQGLDLSINKGEMLAIIGKSGSGKSTLLNIIAGLDRPSAGTITVAGKDLLRFNNRQLEVYNRETIGFVWQNNARNLIPYLSARFNIEVPMMITGQKQRKDRSRELLDIVGLANRYDSKPNELSGGEQQRVAIAIALANDPQIILADEPTGAVDSKTAGHIVEIFQKLNTELGKTVILVTHDRKVEAMVKRVVSISDGMIGNELIRRMNYQQRLSEIGEAAPGKGNNVQDLYSVIDNKGRLKIPEELLNQLDIRYGERIKIRKSTQGLELYKDDTEESR